MCEAGEWEGISRLREWNGGRLRITLERMLGDSSLAAHALEAALDDIWRHAGAHRAMGIEAEDWLFGRLRHVAQSYRSETATTVHLRPVPTIAAPASTDAPSPASPIEPILPADEPDPVSRELVNSRIRHPSAPVQSRSVGRGADAELPSGRRAWLRFVLLWLLAGILGFVLAVAGLLWLTGISPFAPATDQARPGVSTATEPPQLGPHDLGGADEIPSPSARELLGPPLAAPEPPADVPSELLSGAPIQATTPAATPSAAIPVTSNRVVIHFGSDSETREVAQRLADQLRRADYGTVELKAVPFAIGSASVRFFHTEDRLVAERLVNALGPFLVWQGRAAPTAPIDFTDYRPLPDPGALEIWLPRR